MENVADRISTELQRLTDDGWKLLEALKDEKLSTFATLYESWYTRALAAVRSLIPDREADFRRLYEQDPRQKKLDAGSYRLSHYVQGLGPASDRWGKTPFDIHQGAFVKFNNQLMIIDSAKSRLTDILANIRGGLQADLFDSELDASRHLLKNGHLRAAGAVAGVVLEGHLAQVCDDHGVKVPKKDPHISDFNDALKKADVFDVPQWRQIQRFGDIRNYCDHKKSREPRPDEVEELINGVDKAIKTLR